MNSKQLFFFSLILLSVAMGMNWFKNRPKTRPVKTNRPRVALNLSDLQLQDENTQTETSTQTDTDSTTDDGEPPEDSESPPEGDPETGTGEEPDLSNASAPTDLASGTIDTTDPLLSDPVIVALKQLPRNPFETSPYAQLVEQLRMASEISDEPVEKKKVALLNADFSATIQTARELVAVIDKRLFREGEPFQDKKITEIKTEYVSLESEAGVFLLHKKGVKIEIAEDGTYTVDDSFHKK
jgi:hypothetical protein